ncbi:MULTISPECIES: class I SAM-dependent methyltransferase [Vitreoscilla]|uniref:Methyltransferase domain-containing protein n=1 Tax=Vitreoscilla stercoraria TaxID=61 RepID=A0ABY4E8F2_VITST|nr:MULTISPECIES: methyltransferase domain-containing protein [Vitreoscilla]AUZ04551.1 hypothetical protein ADP71_08020 [Vitreoscilla sp. C1]UOO91742.1 methyltransferase domain-containing protein [Vitreoscilla stercoraria]
MNSNHLQTWLLQHPHGKEILAQVQTQLQQLIGTQHYEHALQLGLPSVDLLPQTGVVHRYIMAEQEAPIVAQFDYLPLPTESMDLVVLPFALSQYENRHAILREVQRVLCGYGQLVIVDLNPHSLWRIQSQQWQRLTACHSHQSVTPKHMADWLKLLDLQPQSSRFIHYGPLFTGRPSPKWQWLELAGNRWWPHMAAMYAMLAIKQTVYLRPLSEHARHRHLKQTELILNPASSESPKYDHK